MPRKYRIGNQQRAAIDAAIAISTEQQQELDMIQKELNRATAALDAVRYALQQWDRDGRL